MVTIFLLGQGPQCYQAGVGSWKEALSQDNGLKCPVGLLAYLPFSQDMLLQPWALLHQISGIGFLPIPALQPCWPQLVFWG